MPVWLALKPSSSTGKQGLNDRRQQMGSSSEKKGLNVSRRHQKGVYCNNYSTQAKHAQVSSCIYLAASVSC